MSDTNVQLVQKTPERCWSEFQHQASLWAGTCFGPETLQDLPERAARFMEEAFELVQACGLTRADVFRLMIYTFGRPASKPAQEVGGVAMTLAVLCTAHHIELREQALAELEYVWKNIEAIAAKHKTKIKGSCLPGKCEIRRTPRPPGAPDPQAQNAAATRVLAGICKPRDNTPPGGYQLHALAACARRGVVVELAAQAGAHGWAIRVRLHKEDRHHETYVPQKELETVYGGADMLLGRVIENGLFLLTGRPPYQENESATDRPGNEEPLDEGRG